MDDATRKVKAVKRDPHAALRKHLTRLTAKRFRDGDTRGWDFVDRDSNDVPLALTCTQNDEQRIRTFDANTLEQHVGSLKVELFHHEHTPHAKGLATGADARRFAKLHALGEWALEVLDASGHELVEWKPVGHSKYSLRAAKRSIGEARLEQGEYEGMWELELDFDPAATGAQRLAVCLGAGLLLELARERRTLKNEAKSKRLREEDPFGDF